MPIVCETEKLKTKKKSVQNENAFHGFNFTYVIAGKFCWEDFFSSEKWDRKNRFIPWTQQLKGQLTKFWSWQKLSGFNFGKIYGLRDGLTLYESEKNSWHFIERFTVSYFRAILNGLSIV